MQIYKLMQRGGPSALVTYLDLYYEFTPIWRYSSEKLQIFTVSPRNVKEPYRRLSGKLGPYLAMANVSRCR